MEASNISASPIWDATLGCFRFSSTEVTLLWNGSVSLRPSRISTSWSPRTPLVSRKSREMFTISSPWKLITRRRSSVTTATMQESRFSSYASCLNSSNLSASIKTAIRSCDSEMASSVPDKPLYFTGTLSRSILNPSAISPTATLTPPAPKSFAFLISFVAFGLRNNLCSLRSIGAFPF